MEAQALRGPFFATDDGFLVVLWGPKLPDSFIHRQNVWVVKSYKIIPHIIFNQSFNMVEVLYQIKHVTTPSDYR